MQKEGIMKLRWKYRQVTGGNKGKKSRGKKKKLFYDRINKTEKRLAIMTMGGYGVGRRNDTHSKKKKKKKINFSTTGIKNI